MKSPIFSSVVLALSAVVVSLFSGCTAWKEGVQQDIVLKSIPSGATVAINGIEVGKTPLLAKMRTKNIYAVTLKKDGYRPFETIISPETNLPFIRTGLYTDTGRYNTLKPNPVDASLVAELVPESASVDPYADLVIKIMQVDQLYKDGKMTAVEHKTITQQLIDAYSAKK